MNQYNERAPLPAGDQVFALLVRDAEATGQTRGEAIKAMASRYPDAHRNWLRAVAAAGRKRGRAA